MTPVGLFRSRDFERLLQLCKHTRKERHTVLRAALGKVT